MGLITSPMNAILERHDRAIERMADTYVAQRQLDELKDRFEERYKITTEGLNLSAKRLAEIEAQITGAHR